VRHVRDERASRIRGCVDVRIRNGSRRGAHYNKLSKVEERFARILDAWLKWHFTILRKLTFLNEFYD